MHSTGSGWDFLTSMLLPSSTAAWGLHAAGKSFTSVEIRWFWTMSSVFANQNFDIWVSTLPFLRDRVRQHHVKGGYPVRGDDQQRIAEIIDIAHFSALRRF